MTNVGVMGGSYTRQVSTSTASPTSHSCLATNKQILLKDEIKQNKLFSEDIEVWNSLTTPLSDHVTIYLWIHFS